MVNPREHERWVTTAGNEPHKQPPRVHTSRYCGHIRHHDYEDLKIIEISEPNPVVQCYDPDDPLQNTHRECKLCTNCKRRLDD